MSVATNLEINGTAKALDYVRTGTKFDFVIGTSIAAQ